MANSKVVDYSGFPDIDVRNKLDSFYSDYDGAINYLEELVGQEKIASTTLVSETAYLRKKIGQIKLRSQQTRKKDLIDKLDLTVQKLAIILAIKNQAK